MKMITHDEGLRLLGLWTLATERYRLLRQAEHALNRAIGLSYQGHVSDALYQSDGGNSCAAAQAFYEALERDGVVIAADENQAAE